MKATECLDAEHGVFLIQLSRLDLANNEKERYGPEALRAMVELIRVAVDHHAHVEEAGIYKALEPHLGKGQGPLAVMELEHEEIRKTVQEIASWKPSNSERALRMAVAHFSDVLRSHISKETQILFPMTENLLGEKKLVDLALQCSCQGSCKEVPSTPIEIEGH